MAYKEWSKEVGWVQGMQRGREGLDGEGRGSSVMGVSSICSRLSARTSGQVTLLVAPAAQHGHEIRSVTLEPGGQKNPALSRRRK